MVKSERRERKSWTEICASHPDEWVVLVEMEWESDDPDAGVLLGAVVVSHSRKHDEVLSQVRALRLAGAPWAHLFTGDAHGPLPLPRRRRKSLAAPTVSPSLLSG